MTKSAQCTALRLTTRGRFSLHTRIKTTKHGHVSAISSCPNRASPAYSILGKSSELKELSPGLYNWLDKKTGADAGVVFGGYDGSYIAWHTDESAQWYGILDKPKEVIREGGKIKCAALGVDKSWAVIWAKGGFNWNLRGEYEQLDSILSAVGGNDVQVRYMSCSLSVMLTPMNC